MPLAHIEIPEAKLAEVCQRIGIRKLALFGSVLTDRFSDSSDIDVLVEFLPDQRVGFFRHACLKRGLQYIIRAEAKRYSWQISVDAALEILDLDLELNAQGLAIWFDSLSAAR